MRGRTEIAQEHRPRGGALHQQGKLAVRCDQAVDLVQIRVAREQDEGAATCGLQQGGDALSRGSTEFFGAGVWHACGQIQHGLIRVVEL